MMNLVREGRGKPLLLVHGLGGSWRSWSTIHRALAEHREVLAIDLPGHGATPAEPGSDTFAGLTDSVAVFLVEQGLEGIDIVGSSVGARLVLELARRGSVGAVVSLDPGGFWQGWERIFFRSTLAASIRLVRGVRPALPALAGNVVTRTMLLAQLSARPWALRPQVVASELESFAATPAFDAIVRDLAAAPQQKGPAAPRSGPVTIGWGRHDRLCLPRQAERAQAAFPGAELHWFDRSGHFPMWDQPDETVRVILDHTG